jgi:hypothetical protein
MEGSYKYLGLFLYYREFIRSFFMHAGGLFEGMRLGLRGYN